MACPKTRCFRCLGKVLESFGIVLAFAERDSQNGMYRFGSGLLGRTAERWQESKSLIRLGLQQVGATGIEPVTSAV